ncbi:efflux RND transporter periplasmic adaptor subunit [Leptospira wolffii]|uniref:Efflux RND transporter periplasmic adaptor subunit n=1 Tax=Leptospira wolffii TaxID=409998 RepID=A0ABV5BTG7_9LEPT|nr:efflux RND transporter periplasmic adaptor subunit [Leptospira wolffii]TGK54819.1 HlyD family efflux transporter periplasmic adaptor subunit [Leptospira wolffii]TGK65352.1 HlyD family efflux transporter periplasmic adaptor subunit [Leptospira wolffii]TGK70741.1 HlyD family efflux transporter periplasmic adaptor subunit [Leptospira wolffii]TGL26450.1 HlyD family efflux transporter periplasmic adaptor subunit [Leptospira wolffii]TGL44095.1 HlyD family efflux transporter periplasmic adaptor su
MNKLIAWVRQLKDSKKGKVILSLIVLLPLLVFSLLVFRGGREEVSPKVGPIVELVYSLGTVKSDRVYHLKLGVTASIRKLYVQEGQEVKQGAQLLDTDSGTLFRAPFTGTVTSLPFREGEVVMPGNPVLTILDLKKTYVLLSLDQDSMLRIRPGQKAELSFETIRGNKLSGTVSRVYPSDGQFYVNVEVASMPEGVLPEMTADVAVEVSRKEKALLIPVKALEKGRVRIRREGKSKWVEAKIGAVDGEWCEVLDQSILETDLILMDRK